MTWLPSDGPQPAAAGSGNALEQLTEIRSLMERSSRFLSLSGLSGIAAGSTALAGALLGYARLNWWKDTPTSMERLKNWIGQDAGALGVRLDIHTTATAFDLMLIVLGVLIVATSLAAYFTQRRARRQGQPLWDALTQRLLTNLAIPLFTGGLLCLILLYQGQYTLVSSVTLIFYGLALVNASKYTLPDIRWLGLTEIALGLLDAALPGSSLLFWALGFGVGHIVYGAIMYHRYERTA